MEVLGVKPPSPVWVKLGTDFHDRQKILSKNRAFRHFNLFSAERLFDKHLVSRELGVHGIADLILMARDELCPVEFKMNAGRPHKGQIIQLAAYGMIAEEMYSRPLKRGFIITGRRAVTIPVVMDEGVRDMVVEGIRLLKKIIYDGRMPLSSASIEKCTQCEFINYCNDRL